jgi:thiol-disulfide isomerase/thioredoxin
VREILFIATLFAMSTSVAIGDSYYRGLASSILGTHKSVKKVDPVKVVRSECTVCNGTGKVRTGDGLGVSDCTNCVPDVGKESTSPKYERVMFLGFTARWCGPCQPYKRDMAKSKMIVKDWDGTGGEAHFWWIDTDKFPDLAKQHEITSIPTTIVVGDGKVVQKINGPLTREFVESLKKELLK